MNTTNQPKKTEDELAALLRDVPRAGTRWRHYKGNLYFVQCCAIDEETHQPSVIYHRFNSSILFVRPLWKWNEVVDCSGKRCPRFEQVD